MWAYHITNGRRLQLPVQRNAVIHRRPTPILPRQPFVHPLAYYRVHDGSIVAFSDNFSYLLTPCQSL